jgi:molybdopterin-guanine dinucleotide biosynthesis protein A
MKEAKFSENLGCVILAGGKSSRMGGKNKALMRLDGKTYLELIADELSDFEERILSGGEKRLADIISFRHVTDLYHDCGPMGGLYSSLLSSSKDALFVVSCDMPFFRRELAFYIADELNEKDDALIFEDTSGDLHPLCGIYKINCLPVMKECLDQGQLKMLKLIERLKIRSLSVPAGKSYLKI